MFNHTKTHRLMETSSMFKPRVSLKLARGLNMLEVKLTLGQILLENMETTNTLQAFMLLIKRKILDQNLVCFYQSL